MNGNPTCPCGCGCLARKCAYTKRDTESGCFRSVDRNQKQGFNVELDTRVAFNVMGFTRNGDTVRADGGGSWDSRPVWDDGRPRWLPNYSTSMDDASNILKRIGSENRTELVWDGEMWTCSIIGKNGTFESVNHQIPAEAICFAALRFSGCHVPLKGKP